MKRTTREITRERRDAQRRDRAAREAAYAQEAVIRAAKANNALARWAAPTSIVEEALAQAAAPGQRLRLRSLGNHPLFAKISQGHPTPDFVALLRRIDGAAPRLLDPTYVRAIYCLSEMPFVRPPADWYPRGKGRETLFRSLAEHLVAAFPMPAFLWSALFDESADQYVCFVSHVAGGGSVFEAIRQNLLPVPLSRKMCHDLMKTPCDIGFLQAIRRVQVRSCGGDLRLLRAWMGTRAGRQLYSPVDETFWMTVLEWFAKNPMIDSNVIGPLVDYVNFRREAEPTFSMKGRGVLAMMRGMEEWHGELARAKVHQHGAKEYKPSGFQSLEFDRSRWDESHTTVLLKDTWHVREVLRAKDLADEGRAMKHCVFSYGGSIERGLSSIWSLTHETWTETDRCLTIQVLNNTRTIVQARGKANRQATAQEYRILLDWANKNGLTVSTQRL